MEALAYICDNLSFANEWFFRLAIFILLAWGIATLKEEFNKWGRVIQDELKSLQRTERINNRQPALTEVSDAGFRRDSQRTIVDVDEAPKGGRSDD